MNERSLTSLELPKILQHLAAHTAFSASRELALSLRPSSEWLDVQRGVQATSEARLLLDLKPNAGVGGARDVRPFVQRAVMGGSIEPSQFLDVLATLQSSRVMRGTAVSLADQLPILSELARRIVDCRRLEQELARCINEQAELTDVASPTLGRIRANTRAERDRLLTRLGEIVNSGTYRTMLQEAIITQRDGRYVVPVKAEYRGRFRGVIHDQSASGATLFIEPLATVDSNNRIRELELAEQHEIERILRELSSLLAAHSEAVDGNVGLLAELDLILAKAKYATHINASQPEVVRLDSLPEREARIALRDARHPLLTGNVVPIAVHLGGEFNVLVITGPNTGGKTVTLKAVGLLAMMAQCGMHIPAEEGSRLAVFDEIFADIGDEQSIEQSLSTFSSHLRNIARVLERADSRSLVLLDELGAGTDPAEGSALAQAILDDLLQRRALVIATTHYSELKAYAHLTECVENASVEFDLRTLAPTYRLRIGLPGPSNALAIAARLAIPQEIIEAAKGKMNPDELAVERLLGELRAERERAVAERRLVEQRADDLQRERSRLAAEMADLDHQRQTIIAAALDEAQTEAEKEIAHVRQRLKRAISELASAKHDSGSVLSAVRDPERAERDLAERRYAAQVARQKPREAQAPKRPVRPGDAVAIGTLGQEGEVIAVLESSGEADVQVGSFKLRVLLDGLSLLPHARQGVTQTTVHLEHRDAVPLQIEVRGWRAEEVRPVVDKYIQDAYLAGLPSVRIVHGKGTGTLRRLVREQLASNPLVLSLRQPESRDGGEGVTVVELAR